MVNNGKRFHRAPSPPFNALQINPGHLTIIFLKLDCEQNSNECFQHPQFPMLISISISISTPWCWHSSTPLNSWILHLWGLHHHLLLQQHHHHPPSPCKGWKSSMSYPGPFTFYPPQNNIISLCPRDISSSSSSTQLSAASAPVPAPVASAAAASAPTSLSSSAPQTPAQHHIIHIITSTFIITTLGVTGLSVSHCPQQKGDGGGL